MKKIIFIFFAFWGIVVFGQVQDAWVYFNDKPQAQYYLNNPLEMLSQRALDRRVNQNIMLDFTDVPIHQPYLEYIISLESLEVKAQSKWLNSIHIRGTYEDILSLYSLSFVENIEFADKTLNLEQPPNPILNLFTQQKALNFEEEYLYGNAANQIELHNGHLLHQEGFTGNHKIVAVLDNGFLGVNTTSPFQRLHTENLILGGYDFVNRNPDFYSGGDHGTRVLSVIGGYQENELIGSAPNTQFYLFITEDNLSESPLEESLWVEAAEVADSLGVDIINTSLGYNTFDNPNYNYTYQDMNGITTFISRGANMAYSKGMLCVVSAGNSGNSSWQYITAPADAQGVLTVGAINNEGIYASFSSIGPTSDQRVKPDIMAQGVATINANQNGTVTSANGTSFSAPVITGLVACLWEAFPNLTNEELMQYIKESAHLYDNPTSLMGYGIPDFYHLYQTLGVYDVQETSLLLYPNPTTDFLYLYGREMERREIRLFDFSGKKILKTTINNSSEIDVRYLPSGMYFYQILTENQILSGKIMKK